MSPADQSWSALLLVEEPVRLIPFTIPAHWSGLGIRKSKVPAINPLKGGIIETPQFTLLKLSTILCELWLKAQLMGLKEIS